MENINDITQKTLSALLIGKDKKFAKFQGKHVMVVKDKIIPLSEDKKTLEDFKLLKKKYGRPPVITFVPRADISYIL